MVEGAKGVLKDSLNPRGEGGKEYNIDTPTLALYLK